MIQIGETIVDRSWLTQYKEVSDPGDIANAIDNLIDQHCSLLRDGHYNDQYLIQLIIKKAEDQD